MSNQTILKHSRQISEAMVYLHSKNILHLDLKPENIMLTSDYSVRIIDFGESLKNTRTKLGKNVRMSPYYSPPEIFSELDKDELVEFDSP